MAQYARPDADLHVGNYEDEGAATTNLYESIDEATASDTDYVVSDLAPSNSPYVVSLGTLEDPLSSSGHVVRYRFKKSAAGGATIGLTVQLRQGYVSEASQGTLIASKTESDIGSTWTDGSFTLTSGEADSITDYTDLSLRIVANQT